MKRLLATLLLSITIIGSICGERRNIDLEEVRKNFIDKNDCFQDKHFVVRSNVKGVNVTSNRAGRISFFSTFFENVDFLDVSLKEAYFCSDTEFMNVNFNNVVFDDNMIETVGFFNTKIENSKITNSCFSFCHYSFDNCKVDEDGELTPSLFEKMRSSKICETLILSDCQKVDSIGLTIESTEIRRSRFVNHTFKGLSFKSSTIDDCLFKNVDFSDFDISGVNITNSFFVACKMDEDLKSQLKEAGNIFGESVEDVEEQLNSIESN